MADVVTEYRFLVRGGTAANLTAVNEVLKTRELCFETDTRKFKLGDGATRWSDLPYASGGGGFDLLQAYKDTPEGDAEDDARILVLQGDALASVLLSSVSGASDAADVSYSGDVPGANVEAALDNVAASLADVDTRFDAIGRLTITAGDSLSPGQFIYVAADGLAYPADYNSESTAASAYVLSAVAAGAAGTAFTGSANTALTGLVPGSWYALGAAGAASLPSSLSAASGTILQILGVATSSTSLAAMLQPAILRG